MVRARARHFVLGWLLLLVSGLLLLPAPRSATADPPSAFPETPYSMGQPRRVRLTWGPLSGYDFDAERQRSRLFVAANAEPRVPQLGLAHFTMEGAAGVVGGDFDLGVGVYLKIPWVKAGVEYSFTDHEYIPAFSAEIALKRGGLFRNGDELRVDYRPWDEQVLVGFTFNSPFRPYRMTRPRKIHASPPDGKKPRPEGDLNQVGMPDELLRSLSEVDHAIEWMDKLLTPRFGGGEDLVKDVQPYRDHIQIPGHTFAEEDARYHRELARAFRLASGGDDAAGDDLAQAAEAVILERIVIPFNRFFGQNKKPHHVRGYAAEARSVFDEALAAHLAARDLDAETNRIATIRSREVFRRVVDRIDRVSGWARKRWKQSFIFWLEQSRLVWLPLNYGLRPTQYDTPEEWNALAESLTGGGFTDANTIEYLPNERFHLALKRMIRDTEAYHVLHIHDLRGRTKDGEADPFGWDLLIDGYIEAFRGAIHAMDAGERERLPQFMLFLDENYYQENRSREIITYLENLYRPDEVRLKPDALQQRLESAQAELRRTVDESPTLRGLNRKRREELIRVHVNITSPFDVAFAADVPMRDHRKLAFRDVFETDPGSGEAIFTGHGVGTHYNGSRWEDRTLRVRGAALVDLKTVTRELCRSQGFRADEVPPYLREIELPDDYADRGQALRDQGWTTSVSMSFNRTGYGEKPATTLKAICYNLAPPGGTILTFDSLWISDYWAGMVVGAALRGVRVYVVSPGPENAPSSAAPTMVLMRENLRRMFDAGEYFADEIAGAGGRFRLGLYALEAPIYDIRERVHRVLEGRAETPFLAEEFPFSPEVRAVLRDAENTLPPAPTNEELTAAGIIPYDADHRPFLHQKTHLVLSREVVETQSRPEWASVLKSYLEIRSRQVYNQDSEEIVPGILSTPDPGDLAAVLDSTFAAPTSTGGRPLAWLFVGSQNQDRRGMLLDGEALAVVSGRDGLIAMPDFMFVLNSATWPASAVEFDAAFPEVDGPGFLKKLYRYIKDQI